MTPTHVQLVRAQSIAVVIACLLLPCFSSCGGGNQSNNGGTQSPPISISITSQILTVNPGEAAAILARVTNTDNIAVAWSVSCAQGVSDCGSIRTSTDVSSPGVAYGLYTAPAIAITSSTVTVKAVSAADSTKSSSTTFQLAATAVHIPVPPSTINAGLSYKLSAVVTATNKSVTWNVTCSEGVADCGSIGVDGTYRAPASVAQSSLVTVKATSVADSTKADSFSFTLLPPIAVALTPGSVEVVKGFSYLFAATTQNDLEDVGLTWAVNDIPGGNAQVGTIASIVDPNSGVNFRGIYKAPATAPSGPITITAISAVDPSKSANASVTLISNPHPDFTGDCAFVLSDNQLGFEGAGGILTLDGAGNITGKVDINSGPLGTVLSGLKLYGIYGFEGRDGGWGMLVYSQAGQTVSMTFKLAMISDKVAKVMEFDGKGNMSGTIERQDANIASALDGRHVFTLKGYKPGSNSSLNETFLVVGQFTGTAGHINGIYDLATDNSLNHQSHTTTANAWYEVVGKAGTVNLGVRDGTSLQDSPDFFLYPVSTSRALVMSKVTPVLVGSIDRQSNDTFSNATLAGDWTYYFVNGVLTLGGATLGRFSTDGSGSSAPGCEDWTGGSSTISPICYSINLNSFTVTADGRGFAPYAQFAMPYPVSFYFVDADHGYIATQSGLGEFFRRQGSPFNNSSLNGNYTAEFTGTQDYFFNAKTADEIGAATFDGNGSLTMVTSRVDARNHALLQGYTRNGTYAFDSDLYATGDRGAISLGPDFQLLYYTVSTDKVLMIQYAYEDVSFGIMRRSAF
jgi:hypothetical protein